MTESLKSTVSEARGAALGAKGVLGRLRARQPAAVSSGSAGSNKWSQAAIIAFLLFLLFLTLVPVLFMLVTSLKNRGQIFTQFWALPNPPLWENYTLGWRGMRAYIMNSLLFGSVSVAAVVLLSSLTGYVFARHRFPGKEFIYMAILALMMIPGVLTLIPSFVLVRQLGLIDTPWALILPWTAGGQVFGILLCRSFLSTLPQELFEAGRIDGAGELSLYWRVALPLSFPILITLAIMHFVSVYNDFIWPLVTITDPDIQVVGVGLRQFVNQWGVVDIGGQMAGYAVSVVPLLILFTFGMKYYIQGVTAGALKA
jgi:ABC-type glycerol-3-phosphate transport system permease component